MIYRPPTLFHILIYWGWVFFIGGVFKISRPPSTYGIKIYSSLDKGSPFLKYNEYVYIYQMRGSESDTWLAKMHIYIWKKIPILSTEKEKVKISRLSSTFWIKTYVLKMLTCIISYLRMKCKGVRISLPWYMQPPSLVFNYSFI